MFRKNIFLKILLAVLVLAAFSLLGLHHHDYGQDSHHCQICQTLRVLSFLVLALSGGFLFVVLTAKRFLSFDLEFASLFHPSSNRNRAPPAAR